MARKKKTTHDTSTDLAVIEADLVPVRDTLGEVLRFVSTVPLTDTVVAPFLGSEATGLAHLGTFMGLGKEQLTLIDGKRKEITDPLLQAKKRVDDLFRPARDSAQAVIDACKSRITAHMQEAESAKRAALETLRVSPGDTAAGLVAHGEPPALPSNVGTVVRMSFEVVDFGLLPDEFKLVNESALRALAVSSRGTAEVPGVKFVEVVTLRDK